MSETIFKPVTAITMGDPAGIGPEIVVGNMLSVVCWNVVSVVAL